MSRAECARPLAQQCAITLVVGIPRAPLRIAVAAAETAAPPRSGGAFGFDARGQKGYKE